MVDKKEYQGEEFKAYMSGYREGCKDTTTELCSCNLTEEDWDSLGEPMTQEELDKLHYVEDEHDEFDEIFDEGFNCGFQSGHREGYSEGFDCGYKEAQEYNVILDGEILDEIYDFKESILAYRKEPWRENSEHNHMIFEIHKGLIELTETWVMNQVWNYWHKREDELKDLGE